MYTCFIHEFSECEMDFLYTIQPITSTSTGKLCQQDMTNHTHTKVILQPIRGRKTNMYVCNELNSMDISQDEHPITAT